MKFSLQSYYFLVGRIDSMLDVLRSYGKPTDAQKVG